MPKALDRELYFCYKTPGSAKLTGGAPGLQIRCGAVKAVLGGFDSHALPPPDVKKTPGPSPGVFCFNKQAGFIFGQRGTREHTFHKPELP
jgi:hypothetical protein